MIHTFAGGQLPSFLTKHIRNGPSPSVRDTLRKYGDVPIVGLQLCRRPLSKVLTAAGDVLSAFALSQVIRQNGYDQLYHLYCLLHLQNQVTLLVDKSEVVRAMSVPGDYSEAGQSCIPVPGKKIGTLNELFERGKKTLGNRFWLYDAANNNCQIFLVSIFGDILNETQRKWVLQNVQTAIKKGSLLQRVARTLTDTAALAHRIIYGKGLKNRKRKRRRL